MPRIVETLNEIVDAELEDPPADMLARFRYISELIAEFGLERVREPHVKQLRGALWEIRLQGRDGVSKRRRRLLTGDRTGDEASEGDFEMAKVNDLHLKWMKNGEYRKGVSILRPRSNGL